MSDEDKLGFSYHLLDRYLATGVCEDARCCAGVTPEKHEAALLTMESCQIKVRR